MRTLGLADIGRVSSHVHTARAAETTSGTLVGSYGKVAAMLDEAAEMPGGKGIMLTFDDFLAGMDDYGTRIQPLMRCRKPMPTAKNPE